MTRRAPGPLTPKQRAVLKTFADQAVIAIENTRLLNELRESLQQQTATADVLKVISRSTFDLQTVLDTLVESAARLCEADMASINRASGDAYRQVACYGQSTELQAYMDNHPIPSGRGSIVGRTVLEGGTIHVHDVLADPDYRMSEAARIGGIRTMLGVPLLREGTPIGVIALQRKSVRPFTEKQIELVNTFADQAVIAIENVRLFDAEQARTRELSESLEQQTATSEVLRVISSSAGELQPVFEVMLANATKLCNASYGAMWLADGEAFRTAALHGALPAAFNEQWKSGTLFRPGSDSLLIRAVKTRKAVQDADIRQTRRYLEGESLAVAAADIAGIRTVIAVPMIKDDEPIGVISIYRKEVHPFSDKQTELVTNFASQAVIAIENTRLLTELRESLQQQTATADVLKVISRSTFDLQTVLDTLTESAARLCEADMAAIIRQKGAANYWATSYGLPQEHAEYVKSIPIGPGRGTVTGRVLLEGKTVHIVDVLADPEYAFQEAQRRVGFRTILGVPLVREEMPIGIVVLMRRAVSPFTDKQIELVTTFADQAVIAIENARLFDEVQARTRDLSESLEQQTATAEVLRVISSSSGDLQPVFESILANATRICGAKFGALFLSEGDAFRNVALHGAPPDFAEARRREPVLSANPGTAIGRVAATKQPVQIADIRLEPAYKVDPTRFDVLNKAGARTMLNVPMLKDNELLGQIAIYRQEVRPFTDKQLELVSNFAKQAVIAIENVRLLNELRERTDDLSESLQQQTATANVLEVISRSAFDLQRVFDIVTESAVRLCEADRAFMFRFDGELLRLAAAVNASAEMLAYTWSAIRSGPGAAAESARAAARTADHSHSRCKSRSGIFLRRAAH